MCRATGWARCDVQALTEPYLFSCGNHVVSGRIEKAKWLGLSLPTWKGHTALREESLTSRTVLEKSATLKLSLADCCNASKEANTKFRLS
jgi:hypothetical protein